MNTSAFALVFKVGILPTFDYLCFVNVVSRKTLVAFYNKHANAQEALETWYKVCRKANWKDFNDVKQMFPAADWIGDYRVIFNIKGNHYRLVARISFKYKAILIKWIGTHEAYNSINALKI